MFNFTFTYKWLHWRRPTGLPPALPDGIERLWVPTPGGKLEVLHAKARGGSPGSSPFFFVHGGMGGAWVWLEYMDYLSARGIPCYAVSLRGHGSSWHPSFLSMVYATTKRALADDVVAALRWVQEREDMSEVVLVGHSSGGGLSQFVLSEQDVMVKGLVLMGAVPGFGSMGVYMNWWRLDPWFSFRMIFHGWHPNSPLSHPTLTRRVFFSEGISDSYVLRFQRRASRYESFLWPLGMFYRFVDPQRVLSQISGWGSGQRAMILGGGKDAIMTPPIMERLAEFYRSAHVALVKQKKLVDEDSDLEHILDAGEHDTARDGVRFCLVPGAGHHLQNDVMWEVGAKKLLEFYQQL